MKYPDRLEIQTKSTAYTGTSWTKLRDQWGNVKPLGRSSLVSGIGIEPQLAAITADITHLILFRIRPRVWIGMRVVRTIHAFEIVAVNQGSKTLTVSGNQTTEFIVDEKILVRDSTGNDKECTTVSATLNSGNTDVVIKETIPSAVADGEIRIVKFYEIQGVMIEGQEQIARVKEVQ